MQYDDIIETYSQSVSELGPKYDSLTFESVHHGILDLLPPAPGMVLDVGAGTGRDASWLAEHGYEVVAVEPAMGMLEYAKTKHAHPSIQWVQDRLPGLRVCFQLGLSFDLILVNAVWMHIRPEERARAFRKLVSLLRPGGTLIISLRHGPMAAGFTSFPVSSHEIETLANQHGIAVVRVVASSDQLERSDVRWETVTLRLPDDGTEALPLLRHTILNDAKSSTYKLALIRCLVRIADGAAGTCAVDDNDGYISVPLGLVALYWLRMYKPLIENSLPQMPLNRDGKSLGFVGDSFHSLRSVSPFDLRVGARFAGEDARSLHGALKDCRDTIHKMPAFYIKYPNSEEQVFKTSCDKIARPSDELTLNQEYLSSFGQLRVPVHLWLTMSRFACWIEPALISEWVRLMQGYAPGHGLSLSTDKLFQSLVWLEAERDTSAVRTIAQEIFDSGEPVYCVWSGQKLTSGNLDIDHCFPFAAWPCNDLWNLMPAHPRVNNSKSDKLVTPQLLEASRERIFDWWQQAYIERLSASLSNKFADEAAASLPIAVTESSAQRAEAIFDGMLVKRAALKRNLQLNDWVFSAG